MRIDAEQLPRHLQQTLAALYTVTGDDALLQLEAVDRISAAARRRGYSERSVYQVETGFDWSSLLVGGQSLSLFATQRLIEIRIASGKPGSDGAAAIERYCERLAADTLTIVTLPRLDRQGQNSTWFLALQANGVTINADPVARDKLPQWIRQRLALQQQQADDATLNFLAERTEGNLLATRNEIDKLALLFPPGMLVAEDVRQAVLDVARFDVYDLASAMLTGDAHRYRRTLEGLREEGEQAPRVLWVIASELRLLAALAAGLSQGRAATDVMREQRIWGPRQALMQRALRRLPPKQIDAALMQAAQADRVTKGVAAGDAWQTLLELGLTLCGVRLAA